MVNNYKMKWASKKRRDKVSNKDWKIKRARLNLKVHPSVTSVDEHKNRNFENMASHLKYVERYQRKLMSSFSLLEIKLTSSAKLTKLEP